MSNAMSAEVAVLIGRFQPFHNGHLVLLRLALATAPKVVVILGSAFQARSARNPFSWQERAAMIGACLSAEDNQRIAYVPLRDVYEDQRWAEAVRQKVAQQAAGARTVALIGHFKDATSYYLNLFPQWNLVQAENYQGMEAVRIRGVLFEAENIAVALEVLADLVPQAVRHYLKAWVLLQYYAPLVQEYFQVKQYKEAWRNAPYAPIFVTVDAVVKAAGHVLLIRRGGFPGKGLWAIPGGFVEPRERLLQSALRELSEETRLAVLDSTLENALVDVKVFDHPDRSQRGRTITHAHFFDLKLDQLPLAEAADDAAHVAWAPIDKLAVMEQDFFEDHFHILDHFLHLIDE